MNCPNCGNPVADGSLFCASCGTPLSSGAAAPAAPAEVAAPAEPVAPAEVAAPAEPAPDFAEAAAVDVDGTPVAPEAPIMADVPEAPEAPVAADVAAAAAPEPYAAPAQQAMPAAAAPMPYVPTDGYANAQQPPYGQAAAPNYGAQPGGYQQPPQPQAPAPAQKMYAPSTGTSKALAMSVYWGLFPLIFGLVVGDKDTDPFLKHHLNQGLVILIGALIAGFLSFIFIGFILAIYLFVMAIMGTVQAYHSEVTELPLIGKIKLIK